MGKRGKVRQGMLAGIRRMILWLCFAFTVVFLVPVGILLFLISGMGMLSDAVLKWLDQWESAG